MNGVTLKYQSWCYREFKKLRALEEIRRPLAVRMEIKSSLNETQAAQFVNEAKTFIEQASDENRFFNVLNQSGKELGKCEILDFSIESDHVILCPDSPDEPVPRDSERLISRLKKAYKQFMPESTNVILVAGEGISRSEFQSALFGEFHWFFDKNSNQYVKGENLQNGFWSGNSNSGSKVAVWFEIHKTKIDFELLVRKTAEFRIPNLVTELFTTN